MRKFPSVYAPAVDNHGLWDDQTQKAVVAALTRAQLENDEAQREMWQALHEFYDGRFESHVAQLVKTTHPQRAEVWNKNGAGHRYFKLVRMYAERLAVVFHTPPQTYLHRGDGIALQECRCAACPEDAATFTADDGSTHREGCPGPTDPQVRQWRRDEREMRLGETLAQIDALTVVLGQVIVMPCWVRDRIKWQVLAPYEVYVDQDPHDPADLRYAPQISIELRQPVDSLGQSTESKFLTWQFVEDDDKQPWRVFVHDAGGRLHKNSLFADNENHYGRHPMVVWRHGRNPLGGEFWIAPDEDWYRQQLDVCLRLMDLSWIGRYQTHAQGVLTGMPTDAAMTIGAEVYLVLREGDLKFPVPQPNLAELRENIMFDLSMSAVAESMPPDTYRADGTSRTFGAKALEQHSLKLRREKVGPACKHDLEETFEVHKAVSNLHSGAGTGRVRYDDDVKLGVTLAPIRIPMDPFQQAQANKVQMEDHITSPVEIVQEDGALSRAEAERAVAQRAQDNARHRSPPSPPPPAHPEGTRRPRGLES